MALADDKFSPSTEEIFNRNDIMIAMSEFNSSHNPLSPPKLLPLLQKVKNAYLIWFQYYQTLPRGHKYTLGQQIDILWIEIIKTISSAAFLPRSEKLPFIRLAIQRVDTLKILLMVLWEAKSLQDKRYAILSIEIETIGKMLGGWYGQVSKQNSPSKPGEK